ncbi:MAG: carboxylating nicotinate-nucleotide diphosphorylase, partial [Acidilobaceae archaeon]
MEEVIYRKFVEMLAEDSPFWDITTEVLIPENVVAKAVVVAKEEGVVACVTDIAEILRRLGLQVNVRLQDGDRVSKGYVVLELTGNARKVLFVERTALNLLMHCSGVATAVRRMVEKVRQVNPKVRIAATRKTIPFLRYFEKRAVLAGGGDTHRFSLSDAVLIKENHLRIVGDVGIAVKTAREKTSFIHKVEVEVSSIEDLVKAVEAGADIVMLDNMSPDEVRKAVLELK